MAKERWLGRKILEVVSSEFRDRSMDFYVRSFCVHVRRGLWLNGCFLVKGRDTLWRVVSLLSTV